MNRRSVIRDSVLILLFTAVLIWPIFRVEYLDYWGSIDSTFIADARMLRENLPHPGWQPLWYTGTRFDYIYPPALRYGTALISLLGGVSTARAYHLYTGFLYLAGMLGVYWLMLAGTRSRAGAWFATVLTAFVSPCFLLVRQFRWDSQFGVPQRLHVLTMYGEGPHIASVCILPFALAAIWLALRARRPGMLALAAAGCALVVSNNFYGATALALIVPVMVWCAWAGARNWRVPARALAIVGLACGLCAFWLTPSYLGITIANLKLVADPGNPRSAQIFLGCVVILGAVSFRLGNRRPERAWSLFCAGMAGVLSLYILGHEYFGIQVAGVPLRLAPELDLALILAAVTVVLISGSQPKIRLAVVLGLLLLFYPARKYLRHPWSAFPETRVVESTYAWQVNHWIGENLRDARVLATGQIRFWFNAWSSVAQTDGGSMQGMLNPILPDAFWQIFTGDKQEPAVAWLQALGTDAIVVADKTSRDSYRGDIGVPEKFHGLPVLFDDGQGTVIYRIPRAYPGIGRVVDASVLEAAGRPRGGLDMVTLGKLTGETEKPGRVPVSVVWRGFDEVTVKAQAGQGESVLLQETFDEAWTAEENGKSLPIRRDPSMGFMLIPVAPGGHTIRMRFETPGENRRGQIITLLSLLVAGGLGWMGWRRPPVAARVDISVTSL